MFKFFSIGFFLDVVIILCSMLLFSIGVCFINSCYEVYGEYFMFDSISFYLIVLVVLLGVYSQFSFFKWLTNTTRCFLFLSLLFSILCFCVNHCILFWCFYELSMLPLLYLIFMESPYSERFLAGWYFSGYLLITSLPLILLLLYLSIVNNSFMFSNWVSCISLKFVFIILAFVFFTKVPLVPFHTWLPLVHAEATSIVSIFLSGYIMKLGLLGVCRCCSFIFSSSFISYLFMCYLLCISFFLVASTELDGKRWLAFLSLAHIVVPFFGLYISDWVSLDFSFLYCLGHGVSAGLVFGLLWYYYDVSNSRNWLLLKSGINCKVSMLLIVFSLLTLCSFPPTIQFFCEISLVKLSYGLLMYVGFWCFYLFFGGLVPLVLCGHLLTRSEFIDDFFSNYYIHSFFIVYLVMWCYAGVVIL